LFQPEAPGDSEGEITGIVTAGESTRIREDVNAQAQIDPQWEGAEAAISEIDKIEV
jgi:hypothetical protein